jgi:hypothetical protein
MKRKTINKRNKTRKGGVPPLQYMALKSSGKLAHLALKGHALKTVTTSKGLNGTIKHGILILDDLALASHKHIRHKMQHKKKHSHKTAKKSKIQKSLESIPIIINPTEV